MTERQRGFAMLYALLLMVVVVGVGALMFARTVAEIQHSGDDAAIVQTLLLARGAANLGGQTLHGAVREELHRLVEIRSSTTGRWSFGSLDSGASSAVPNPSSVNTDLRSLAQELQDAIDGVLCGATEFSPSTGGAGSFRVYFADLACESPLPAGVTLPGGRFVEGLPRSGTTASAEQTYALPFALVAEGSVADYRRNVVLQGEYRFTVGRGSFAKYALFTNVHRTGAGSSGSDIWFTETTLFDGPVHTNQFFRFYRNPWFGARVTTAGCSTPLLDRCHNDVFDRQGADFYGVGFRNYWNMTPSLENPRYSNGYGIHAPEFAEVDWRSSFVPMPDNNQDQEQAARNGGLHFGGNLTRLTLWAADASGDPLSPNGSGGYSPSASYQYARVVLAERQQVTQCTPSGCSEVWRDSGETITYRYDNSGRLERLHNGSWVTEHLDFNGVVFADGEIRRFTGPARVPPESSDPDAAPPALASFAQVTVAADDFIRITGDLKYESPPCSGVPVRRANDTVEPATCDNLDVANVLGVFTQGGDVLIGNRNSPSNLNAPRNVTIHGVLMTSTGRVEVENYDQGNDPRGSVNLMGGIIEYYYGAFGQFNSSTGRVSRGYDRRFTYDQRMSLGVEPPYFPTVTQDGVREVVVFSFGQREQVY